MQWLAIIVTIRTHMHERKSYGVMTFADVFYAAASVTVVHGVLVLAKMLH